MRAEARQDRSKDFFERRSLPIPWVLRWTRSFWGPLDVFMDMDDIELDLASDQTFGLDSFCWISPLFFKFRRVAVVETGVAADSEVVNSNPLADHSFPQPTIWLFGAVYPISGQSQIRVFRSLIFYTWINLNPKFHDLDGVRLGQRCPHLASQRPEPLLGTQSQGPIGTMDMASLVEPLNPGVMRRCWVSSWDPHWPWQRQQRWI